MHARPRRLDGVRRLHDAGRNFYVFAAVGTRVSAPTRRELQRVVDSLRFEPRGRRAAESP